jgi:signal transduction histidine kinase/DNA-binding response OmpR family regulator
MRTGLWAGIGKISILLVCCFCFSTKGGISAQSLFTQTAIETPHCLQQDFTGGLDGIRPLIQWAFSSLYPNLKYLDDAAEDEPQLRNARHLLFQGFFFALTLLSFVIYLWLPQKRFFYFCLLVAGCLIYDLSVYPQAPLFPLLPLLKTWQFPITQLAQIIIMIGAVKFVSLYVGFPGTATHSARWLNYFLFGTLAWHALGVFSGLKNIELGAWLNCPPEMMRSFFRLHSHIGLLLAAIGFSLVIAIPAIGIFKKVNQAWLLTLSTIPLASGFIINALYLLFLITPDASLPEILMSTGFYYIYSFIQLGELAFITFFVSLIGVKAHRIMLEQHQALQDHTEAVSLRQLDRAKTRFYANISHEFRTPITLIMGMARKVRENPERWFREGLEIIVQNSQRLLNLTNQMLDLSKLEGGTLAINNRQGDVIAFFRALLEPFSWYAQSKNIQLHFLPGQEEIIMDFDSEKLTNICSNLLSNAINFTPEGGQIYFQVATQSVEGNPYLVIKVKDTGIGIAPEHLPFIFDRFFSSPTVPQVADWQGVGIGLALVKELAHLLNGEITVESQLGRGSVFTLQLPLLRHATLQHQPQQMDFKQWVAGYLPPNKKRPVDTPSAQPKSSLPIALVVEDKPDAVAYLKACLEGGYQVKTAENGAQGLEQALCLIPDIIICDVMMPVMDGFEMLERVKKDKRTSHIPIILLTARVDAASRLMGLEKGADAYLPKPFDDKELLLHSRKLIELRKKLQARYAQPSTIIELSADKILQTEDRFILEVHNILETHLGEESFGIPDLCQALAMSRAQLYRKFHALTNQPVSRYIRSFRLHKAKALLETSSLNVTQVAVEVGFKSQSYFSRAFVEEFGFAPSTIRKKRQDSQLFRDAE